jgi:hypothetical protein
LTIPSFFFYYFLISSSGNFSRLVDDVREKKTVTDGIYPDGQRLIGNG